MQQTDQNLNLSCPQCDWFFSMNEWTDEVSCPACGFNIQTNKAIVTGSKSEPKGEVEEIDINKKLTPLEMNEIAAKLPDKQAIIKSEITSQKSVEKRKHREEEERRFLYGPIECLVCSSEISKHAAFCPKCGHPFKPDYTKRLAIGLALFFVFLIVQFGIIVALLQGIEAVIEALPRRWR